MAEPDPKSALVVPAGGLAGAREVWSIAWPTVLTMMSYTVMQFVDKLMLGQVGPLEVAAQGNGGVWAFTPIAVAIGFLVVVNTYVSQNLGAGTPERAPQYGWAAFWICVTFWLVVLLPLALVLPAIFGRLHDPERVIEIERLVRLETGYARILLVGGIVTLLGRALHHFFFGLHRPRLITVAAIVGNGANIVANYVLIFGERGVPALGLPGVPGVPALGLYGAAWGTVLGTLVEVAIPAAVFLGPSMNAQLATRAAWRPALAPIRDLFKIGWPGAFHFGNELLCWSLFMTVLLGRFGEDHLTAGWIALGYMHLSFMPAVGFSVAVTSLVGKYIGAGHPGVARRRAQVGLAMAVGYMTLCALGFLLFRHPMVSAFIGGDVTPAQAENILRIGGHLMICAALFQTLDAVGIVYTGALRGAGDTLWPGMITVAYAWLFLIAGGWLMTERFAELESVGPWIAAAAYIVVLGVTMAWRFESGRWRSIALLEPGAAGAAGAPIGPAPPPATPDASIRDIAAEIAESKVE